MKIEWHVAQQCKQKGAVSCRIGEGPWRSSSQPCLSLFEKCWKTTVGDQVSIIRKTNKHRTWRRKYADESACLLTQML